MLSRNLASKIWGCNIGMKNLEEIQKLALGYITDANVLYCLSGLNTYNKLDNKSISDKIQQGTFDNR